MSILNNNNESKSCDKFNYKSIYEELESNVRVYCRKYPRNFVKANKHYVYDDNGISYIDFMSGAGALNYGHNNPIIKERILNYIKSNALIHSLDFNTPAKSELLNSLNEVILKPRNLKYKVQFTGPTGSNTIEAALKIARKHTNRKSIIAFTNGFHGTSLGALSLTASNFKRSASGVSLQDVIRMPFCGYFGNEIDTISYLEKFISDPGSGIEIPAAIVLETIQGEGGINVASTKWLNDVSILANKYNILLIIDDIQSGCGRTGKFFSFEDAGLYPDIVCLSKSIGGYGFPLALVLIKPNLDNQSPGEHTGTFRGNNIAFVAAKCAIEFWNDPVFIEDVDRICNIMAKQMDILLSHLIGYGFSVRGRGMMQGLVAPSGEIATHIIEYGLRNGIIIETCGSFGEVIKIMPPITINKTDLNNGFNVILNGAKYALSKHSI